MIDPADNPMRTWTEAEWDAAAEDFLVVYFEKMADCMESYAELYEMLSPLQPAALAEPKEFDMPTGEAPPGFMAACLRYYERRRKPAPELREL